MILPPRIRAISSAMRIASSGSCVTRRTAAPSSFSTSSVVSRMPSRRRLSRPEKGSSMSMIRGRGCQRAGERHALLFAPRKLMRQLLRETGKVHLLKKFRHTAQFRITRAAQAESDVALDGEVRKQCEILEHEADRTGFGRGEETPLGHGPPIDQDGTRIGMFDAGDHPQRRRFAAARGAEKAGDLPGGDRQRDIVDHRPATEGTGQMLHVEPDSRVAHASPHIRLFSSGLAGNSRAAGPGQAGGPI